ncbi:microfibrillar-associated protein 2 isoform X2 [Manis javanica]|uniref:microfibrillar-associated protein 2 isoform X2 n=1 Tax=Manis javanica TaxID=9974 RepID=UPI0018792D61|nr:microfibrillar-associated protein 2 isoform X2 [Manis javanica]XP_036855768.1 microfibrillar-associated protein 2 isoform X2 [Manis javanica]
MRAAYLFLLFLPGLLAQGQYDLDPLPPFPDHVQYTHYSDQIDHPDYYDYQEATPRPPEEQFQSQQQVQQEVIAAPTVVPGNAETEPTEPGPLDCREEQYPCTRLYSIHKPCKQCLNEVCFYSLRRVYVVNKEICIRTVCAHEELLRGHPPSPGLGRGQQFPSPCSPLMLAASCPTTADLCRDKFSKCGVMASSGLCQSVAASCARSCGGC